MEDDRKSYRPRSQHFCGDPACVECRQKGGERPLAHMLAEFRAICERMEGPEESRFEPAACRQVSIKVSEPQLVLMAWLTSALETQVAGGVRVGPELDLDSEENIRRVESYLSNALSVVLGQELRALAAGQHPLLFGPPAQRDPAG